MNRNAVIYLQELIVTQMNHWALFSVFMIPVCQLKKMNEDGNPNILFWAAMGMLPFVFYLLRKHLKHLGALAAGHGVVLAVFGFLLYGIVDSWNALYLFFGIGYAIYSLYIRLTKENMEDKEFFMPLAVGLFFVSSYFAHYLGWEIWDSYYVFALIGVWGLYFLYSYLSSYLQFLFFHESSTGHIPEREIFVSGSRLILLFTIISMLLLMLVSNFEWLTGILKLLKAGIVPVLRFLISLIPTGQQGDSIMQNESVSQGTAPDLGEAEESFWLWDILFYISVIALLAGMIYGIVFLLKKFIHLIKSRMYHKTDNAVIGLGHVSDVREKCSVQSKKDGKTRESHSLWGALSPKERIRKLYKKHIFAMWMIPGKYSNHNPGIFTAREWGTFLEEADMPDIYEKARYSRESCTAEDVRHMKEAVKGQV